MVLVAASFCVVEAEAADREDIDCVEVGTAEEDGLDMGRGGGSRGGGGVVESELNDGGGVSQNLLLGGGTAGGEVMPANARFRAAEELLLAPLSLPAKVLEKLFSAVCKSS